MRTAWADGPEFITQCPIRPGKSYTYRFTIQGQEGTLWWHAHSSWLRATVYGALIIHPKEGENYPFPKPKRETPILLGTTSTFSYHQKLKAFLENNTPPVPFHVTLFDKSSALHEIRQRKY